MCSWKWVETIIAYMIQGSWSANLERNVYELFRVSPLGDLSTLILNRFGESALVLTNPPAFPEAP